MTAFRLRHIDPTLNAHLYFALYTGLYLAGLRHSRLYCHHETYLRVYITASRHWLSAVTSPRAFCGPAAIPGVRVIMGLPNPLLFTPG